MNDPKARPPLDHLPTLSPRPDCATDYTAKQRGKMTAIAWCRPSRSGKGTLWLCRCECGLYEYRRPGTWKIRPHPEDMCDVCLRAKGPNSKATFPERFQQWAHDMRSLGLTDEEIRQLQAPGKNVQTRGKTAAQIRAQFAVVKQRGMLNNVTFDAEASDAMDAEITDLFD